MTKIVHNLLPALQKFKNRNNLIMKTLFKKSIVTLFSLLTLASEYDVFIHNPASSLPDNFKNQTMIEIPSILVGNTKYLRVMIYPHTLKNDWRHGLPDDATQFQASSSSEFTVASGDTALKAKNFKFRYLDANTIEVAANNKVFQLISPLTFNAKNTPIKIIRVKNEDKSHSYLGNFKLHTKAKGLELVNTIDLENYLLGVVPSESMPTWPLEALKAQALAARSYALYHLLASNPNKDWDVDDTARYQVYSGIDYRFGSTDRAVKETAGEVITYDKKVIVAFFHSYSGGFTDSAQNIFDSNTAPYCDQSEEIFTREHLKENISKSSWWIIEWTKNWSKENMITALKNREDTKELFKNFQPNEGLSFNVTKTNENYDSVNEVELIQNENIVTMNYKKLRAALNWANFNGYHYYFEKEDMQNITIRGYGWGHHVGMSQWGAFMMSKYFKKNYRDIIYHYYKDTEILKI